MTWECLICMKTVIQQAVISLINAAPTPTPHWAGLWNVAEATDMYKCMANLNTNSGNVNANKTHFTNSIFPTLYTASGTVFIHWKHNCTCCKAKCISRAMLTSLSRRLSGLTSHLFRWCAHAKQNCTHFFPSVTQLRLHVKFALVISMQRCWLH
jgi:hypothetical protein